MNAGGGGVGGTGGMDGNSGSSGAGGAASRDASTPDLDSGAPELDASVDGGGGGGGGDAALAICAQELAPPENGSVSVDGVVEGDVARYGCQEGYGLVGVASRACGFDGEWTGEAPSCAPGDSASLASPGDGTVLTPTGTTFGSVAQYSCATGYELAGSATRTCQANGAWSVSAPSCEIVTCPSLSSPTDGSVSTPSGRAYGQVATYACDAGFHLVGPATRTCQASKAWSGSAPSCADSNTEMLRFTQLHVGNDEFVRITNRGTLTATLVGVRLELRDSSGSNYSLNFASGTLAGGASATVGDSSASPTYTLPLNLAGSRAATALLCEASPCSASTVLDAMSFEGDAVAPAMPAGVSINTPLTGMTGTNDNSEDFYRVAYGGTAPTFRSCDWAVAPRQPIFTESFECGTTGWVTSGSGVFTTNASNASPDGSPLTLTQTAGTINASDGLVWTFSSAIFPTHIEYWQQGGNRVFLCSRNCQDAFATMYWDYQGNLCFVAGALTCHDTPDLSWSRVVFDPIDWENGTAVYRVNDDFSANVSFSSSYVAGYGLRSMSITGGGGRVDGVRMW